jgi:hypothetical protein
MDFITTNTNTIFPFITSNKLIDNQILFAQGTWIDLPNYKSSWVDFGDVVEINELTVPTYFGRNEITNIGNDYTLESIDLNINEELNFDVKPYNVEDKTKVMRSSFCTVMTPGYDVYPTTKIYSGLTSGTTGVIIVNSGGTQDFTFTFTANTNVFSGYNVDFKFSIYKYYDIREQFLKPAVYDSPLIEHSTFDSLMSFTTNLNLLNFNDGEYLIKGYYVYPNCNPIANLMGLKVDTSNFTDVGNSYIEYNDNTDWYFAYLTKAPKPTIIGGVTTTSNNGSLKVETLPIVTSATTYYVSSTPVGDLQVNVNGVTLQPGIDYTSYTNYFTLSSTLLDTDVLTVIYIINSTGVDNSIETYVVPEIIPSTTYPSLGEKLIYNTSSSKYEYWLNSPSEGDVIFSVNGVTLSVSEVMVSSSDRRRIILNVTPSLNDIITVYYTSLVPPVLDISTNPIGVSFYVTPTPQKENGKFFLEFYDYSDTTLSNVLFSGSTDYIGGESLYSITTEIPISYGFTPGQKFWYRVKSVKEYQLLTGDIIKTINYSDNYQSTLSNNGIYNY